MRGRFHYAWIILVMGTLVVFGALGLARFGYSVVLPDMQARLGMDNTQAGAMATANLAGYLALSLIGGALASRFGPRAVLTAGLAIAGVGMLLTGLAQHVISAMIWRAVTGIGSGASNVPVMGLMAVWHLGAVYVAFGFSYIIYMIFFFKRLIAEGGYTPEAAGQLFMIMGWFSLLCGLIWGAASDRIGRKWALVIVYLIHAVVFGLFAVWPETPGFTLFAVLFGLSAWSIPAIMAAACGDLLGPRLAPAALGFITLFFGIGQAVGPSIAGAMADAAGSFTGAFLLAAGVALLGAVGALLIRPPLGRYRQRPENGWPAICHGLRRNTVSNLR